MKELHKFPGGLQLEGFKQLTCKKPSLPAFIPERLIYPLTQHIGTSSEPLVNIGDFVLKGQLLARPGSYVSSAIHASSSGVVEDIGLYQSTRGIKEKSIVIKTDGEDQWCEKMQPLNYQTVSPEILEQRITESGIIGMGGAGFPSHVKVIEGANENVEALIINGVECEPHITCDDRLIRDRSKEITIGAVIVQKIVGARECILAVEEDMPEAFEALVSVAFDDQQVVKVPAIYPAGGEKQLIRTITGKWVPSHGLPIQTGVLVQNVATVAAVYRAVLEGEPLVSRIVTVAGLGDRSQNIEILNGTPVGELLHHLGFVPATDQQIFFGGSMMGKMIMSDQVPVMKNTSCVLVQTVKPQKKEMQCIRCGDCINVCPEQLQPQILVSLSKAGSLQSIKGYRLFDCIECGCCDQVCPSQIPLVQYIQKAKVLINQQDENENRAFISKRRYLSHQQRLDKITHTGKSSRDKKPAAKTGEKDLKEEILAAIQRRKVRREKQKNR